MKNKNNQGFTLIGVLAAAGIISVAVVAGLAVQKHLAKQADAKKITAQTNQLMSNISTSNHAANAEATGNMQLQNLPNANPTPPEAGEGPTSTQIGQLNGGGSNSGGNNTGASNGAGSGSGSNGGGRCASPCHTYVDGDGNESCILSRIDCNCLGHCPALPDGCVYMDEGPGDPFYQPPPNGEGNACPSSPTCTPPYVVSRRYHECRCPGDVTDCTPFGTSSGGGRGSIRNMALPGAGHGGSL